MKSRYVMAYKGAPQDNAREIQALQASEGLHILRQSSPKFLLVEATKSMIEQVRQIFTNWQVTPEQTYSIPDTKPTVRSGNK
jgi:hypothetical protein